MKSMALRHILIHPDARLKKKTKTVDAITDDIRALADDMLETMYDAQGIGLAAPQIGVIQQLFVMDCNRAEDAAPEPMVLVNPKVIWRSDEKNTYNEGCLSIPEQYAEIERPKAVDVSWLGLDGQKHSQRFDGLWATCAQHEIDHLNGRLFIDYLSAMRRQMITRKMQKLKREKARET